MQLNQVEFLSSALDTDTYFFPSVIVPRPFEINLIYLVISELPSFQINLIFLVICELQLHWRPIGASGRLEARADAK